MIKNIILIKMQTFVLNVVQIAYTEILNETEKYNLIYISSSIYYTFSRIALIKSPKQIRLHK